jgi:hypothetical protein
MNDTPVTTETFRVISHAGKDGTKRVGYHCPRCGKFYATGHLTLETDTHVLGSVATAECCGETLALPRTFNGLDELNAFLRLINRNVNGTLMRLIDKNTLVAAHFRPDAIPAEKTTLH